MSYSIACAPYSWGVETPDNPHNPPWMTVMTEARRAGYEGMELGPYGYLPTNPDKVNTALYIKEFTICAGTLLEPLSEIEQQDTILAKTRSLCMLLQKIGASKLIVVDCVNDLRSQFAGLGAIAPRLDPVKWQVMMETIRQIGAIADEYQIRAMVLPHTGSYIEYKDEIDNMLADLSHDEVGLCLDTGYLYYAGMDPAQSLKEYAERLDYLHLKDIDDDILRNANGFKQAYAEGVMCPIGEGVIDYTAVYQALEEINYQGWVTVEQQTKPRYASRVLPDIRRSHQFLQQSGFAMCN